MKRITKEISQAKYDVVMALAEEVVGYDAEIQDGEVDDGNGNMIPNMIPNPQSKELWLESIYNGVCTKAYNHMKRLKRNKELGAVVDDEL